MPLNLSRKREKRNSLKFQHIYPNLLNDRKEVTTQNKWDNTPDMSTIFLPLNIDHSNLRNTFKLWCIKKTCDTVFLSLFCKRIFIFCRLFYSLALIHFVLEQGLDIKRKRNGGKGLRQSF